MRRILVAVALMLVAAVALPVRLDDPGDPGGPVDAVEDVGLGGAPQPVVEGNALVDARTGGDFVPRGVNWSSFEYACAQGWGLSALDNLVARDPDASEAGAIAAWGANTVRLPLNQDCWLGTRGAPVGDGSQERTVDLYRQSVRGFVAALNRAGLVVVLDLHSRKRIGQPEFGNVAMPDSGSLAFWRSVAADYRDDPSVMFDAFNEPYSRYDASGTHLLLDLTWACWRDGGCRAPVEDDRMLTSGRDTYRAQGMDAVVAAIRGTGATQPILLGGLDYANDLSHWLEFAPDDDQLVAAFHSYDFKDCNTRGCWDSVLGPIADRVPLLTSELGSGQPGDGYVESYLAWADERDIGALFWVWADHPGDPMSLVTDESGRPTSYGRIAQDWLAGD